jgi:hypothetical protein
MAEDVPFSSMLIRYPTHLRLVCYCGHRGLERSDSTPPTTHTVVAMPHIGALPQPSRPDRTSRVRQHTTTDSARTLQLAQLHPGAYMPYSPFWQQVRETIWKHGGLDFPSGEL